MGIANKREIWFNTNDELSLVPQDYTKHCTPLCGEKQARISVG